MYEYETLINTIEALSKKNFTIAIEDGRELHFHFRTENFFHLIGLHKLTDLPHIYGAKNKAGIINQIKKDDRLFRQIQKSAHYSEIQERIESFYKVTEMLLTDKCEVIVDFDREKAPETKIASCFLLYKSSDRITYHLLGIASTDKGLLYPETYFVEKTKYYVNGQTLLDCHISHKEFAYKHTKPLNSSNGQHN